MCAGLNVSDSGRDSVAWGIFSGSDQVFFREGFRRLQCFVACFERFQGEVDLDCDFCWRVVVVCCYGFFDLRGVVQEPLVQGF